MIELPHDKQLWQVSDSQQLTSRDHSVDRQENTSDHYFNL